VLVKSREEGAKHCRGGCGGRGKDDRKQNTLAPFIEGVNDTELPIYNIPHPNISQTHPIPQGPTSN
jgi:hypothetical protein